MVSPISRRVKSMRRNPSGFRAQAHPYAGNKTLRRTVAVDLLANARQELPPELVGVRYRPPKVGLLPREFDSRLATAARHVG